MNNRERAMAILHYEPYDRLPLVHFGFWRETLAKWVAEGHVSPAEADGWSDGNEYDVIIAGRLGFDCNWYTCFQPATRIYPAFEEIVLEEAPDGTQKVLNVDGAVVLRKPGITSIPQEFDHLLKGRREWEEHFLPRLQFTPARIAEAVVSVNGTPLPFGQGGRELLQRAEWSQPYGLMCGSLFGTIRNWLGLVGSAYLLADDPDLFGEIIDTVGDLSYEVIRTVLETGARFDFAHFWEDICYNSGPLINPRIFRDRVGPHYRRITDLLRQHGIDIVSVDCDGKIDALIPIWLENGVNTMFPIEVGTWEAEIAPWRAQYGQALRGVGGMNKTLFAHDRAGIDAEIERLKALVDLGGYIPCPDHRIAPDAKWGNVGYYCDRMRQTFG
jgi:uroporphyrinogen decarboxylase